MSTSRLEKFIYAICSMEVSDLPAPLSRIEILWNCLITGETPDFEPQSRNEQYLMSMLGLYDLNQLPTPMSRGEKLLYKIAMGETDLSDIPAYLSRYEELLGYLAENGGVGDFEYILQTLNQRLSTLYSTKERPMKQAVIKGDTLVNELPRPSLKNTMINVASQKLNQGYDNGKTLVNLFDFKETYTTLFNTTYTYSDNKYTVTNNGNDGYVKTDITVNLEAGKTYTFKAKCNRGFNNDNGYIYLLLNNSASNGRKMSNENAKFTTDTSGIYYVRLDVRASSEPYIFSDLMILEGDYTNEDIPYFEGTKTFSATPNVVDGEFKQAVVKGQTLVNLANSDVNSKTISITTTGVRVMFELPYNYSLSEGKTYTVIFETENFIGDVKSKINFSYCNGRLSTKEYMLETIGNKIKTSFVVDSKFKDVSDKALFYFTTGITLSADSSITIKNVIILEGDYTNIDIPYFEGMQSVQLSEVTTTGKNLFDGKNMSNGYVAENGNIDRGNISNSLSDYIKVEPSTSYAYKCFVENQTSIYGEFAFYNEDKKFISVLYAHHNSDTCIITPDNCHYLRVWNNQYSNNGNSHPNAMLVKTTNLPSTLIYEPYQSNTLTLAEPVNLRKVGEVEDEFDALTGQVTERVGEVVLDGSEQWSGSSFVSTNHYCAYTKLSKSKNIMSLDVICDSLPTKDILSSSKDYEGCVINSTNSSDSPGNFVIKIAKSKLSSLTNNGLKEYLSNNPMTLQYQLATSTTKTVTPTITDQDGVTQTKLHSFNDGHLSVSSQGLLPSAVNYEVPTNNSYYLPDMLTLGAQYTSRGSADCNATIDGKLLALGKNRTFTTPSSLTDRLMVLDTAVDDLMFIKGDQTAKDFGYFEGMKSVEFSDVRVAVKNIFDGVSYIDAFIGPNMNVDNDRDVVSILLDVEKNTDYILSSKTPFDRSIIGGSTTPIMIRDVLNKITSSRISNTIAFNSGDYTHIMIYLNSTKIDLEEIQVEKGSVATPYEPYKSTTLTLNEPITLRKVGEVQDTLDGLTGEVTERIGEIVLDGSEDWFLNTNSPTDTNLLRFTTNSALLNAKKVSSDNREHYLTDKFAKHTNWKTMECSWIHYNDRRVNVVIKKDKLISLDAKGLQSWLSQNPLTVQYQLETESIKTVDLTTVDQDGQPTKLKTFNDITHVEIKADNLIPSVDLEVATKISETLATLDPQQLNISNTQNKLGQTIDEQTENTDATMMATTEIYEQTL